jgi:hypothetical protein
MPKIKKRKNKKPFIVASVVALVAIGGIAYAISNHSQKPAPSSTTSGAPINYDPPSKQDTQSVNDNKQRIVQQEKDQQNQTSTNQGSASKQTIKPIITYAGQYGSSVEIGGYINVFEDGGTCQVTFTQGSKTITRSVSAVRDANSVDCPSVSVNSSEFNPKGKYVVTLGYNSNTTTGVSDPKDIEVK